jgi:hypothetical protein
MSTYREELERRRADREVTAARGAAQKKEMAAKIERRAADLLKHMKESGAKDVGATLRYEREAARIILGHPNAKGQTVMIIADHNSYSVATMRAGPRGQPFNEKVPNSHQSVQTVKEVDDYILATDIALEEQPGEEILGLTDLTAILEARHERLPCAAVDAHRATLNASLRVWMPSTPEVRRPNCSAPVISV